MKEPSWEEFKTVRLSAASAKKLVGKTVWYMCATDIDKSGRGLYFPRKAKFVSYDALHLTNASGNPLYIRDIKMICEET